MMNNCDMTDVHQSVNADLKLPNNGLASNVAEDSYSMLKILSNTIPSYSSLPAKIDGSFVLHEDFNGDALLSVNENEDDDTTAAEFSLFESSSSCRGLDIPPEDSADWLGKFDEALKRYLPGDFLTNDNNNALTLSQTTSREEEKKPTSAPNHVNIYSLLSEDTKRYLNRATSNLSKNQTESDFVGTSLTKTTTKTDSFSSKTVVPSFGVRFQSINSTKPDEPVAKSRDSICLDSEVRVWLSKLKLREHKKYETILAQHEIDMDSLQLLNEWQLRRMGVTAAGPLNKMLAGLRSLKNSASRQARRRSRPDYVPTTKVLDAVERQRANSAAPRFNAHHESISVPLSARDNQPRSLSADRSQNHTTPWIPAGIRKNVVKSSSKTVAEVGRCSCCNNSHRKEILSRSPRGANFESSTAVLHDQNVVPNIVLRKKAEENIAREAEKGRLKLALKEALRERAAHHLEKWKAKQRGLVAQRLAKVTAEKQRFVQLASEGKLRSVPTSVTPVADEFKKKQRNKQGKRKNVVQDHILEDDVQRRISCAIDAVNSENTAVATAGLATVFVDENQTRSRMLFEEDLSELEGRIEKLLNHQKDGGCGKMDKKTLLDSIDAFQKQLKLIHGMVVQHRHQLAAECALVEISTNSNSALANSRQPTSLAAAKKKSKVGKVVMQLDDDELQYFEKHVVGEGSFARIFRGKLRNSGTKVAVKRLKIPLTDEERLRLLNNVEQLRKLKSPYLVRILGCVLARQHCLLVTEYAERRSLQQQLELSSSACQLDHSFFFTAACHLASALTFLHEQNTPPLLHLRVTSRNCLLDAKLNLKLSDVGLSRLRYEAAQLVRETGVAEEAWSPLAWSAPELLAALGEVTPAADVFSAAVVLWEMLHKRAPYEHLTLYQIICSKRLEKETLQVDEDVSHPLKTLLSRCLSFDASSRPSSQELLYELQQLRIPIDWNVVLSKVGLDATTFDVSTMRKMLAKALRRKSGSSSSSEPLLLDGGPCDMRRDVLPCLDTLVEVEQVTKRLRSFARSVEGNVTVLDEALSARGASWQEDRGRALWNHY